jgi:hypothetical protein
MQKIKIFSDHQPSYKARKRRKIVNAQGIDCDLILLSFPVEEQSRGRFILDVVVCNENLLRPVKKVLEEKGLQSYRNPYLTRDLGFLNVLSLSSGYKAKEVAESLAECLRMDGFDAEISENKECEKEKKKEKAFA